MRNLILFSTATITFAAVLSGCASVPQRSARGGVLSGTEVERQRYSVRKDPALAGNGQQEVGQSSAALSNSAAPMPTAGGVRTTGPVAPGAGPAAPVAPVAPGAAPAPSPVGRPGVTGGTVTGGTVTSGTGATSTGGTAVGGTNAAGGAGTSTTPPGTASPSGTPNDTNTGSTTGGTSPSGGATGTR